MNLIQIVILAVIQGLAELLPVSSSAHVIAAAKLMRLDPSTPQFGVMLILLHTGTMFAVIVYFWKAWRRTFFNSREGFSRFATKIFIATVVTGIIGYGLKKAIEHVLDPGYTVLIGYSLTNVGSSHAPPTPATLLTDIAAADIPHQPLFKVGDRLTVGAVKGREISVPVSIAVTHTSTLKDLLLLLQRGLVIDVAAPPLTAMDTPGVTLIPDAPRPAAAVRVKIVGNKGSDRRLKFAGEVLTAQKDRVPLRFFDSSKGEVEQLFKRLDLIAAALAAAGLLILLSGMRSRRQQRASRKTINTGDSVYIGAIQGLSLPFRGFSRSGVTISLGLLRGISRSRAEEFSFALAVVLTPVAIGYEALRLVQGMKETSPLRIPSDIFIPGLKGMAISFLAGLIALKLLSKLLESGQWWLFGLYCFAASGGLYWMHVHGY